MNLDESPDKKLIEVPLKDPDTVFTHTPSNPFEMAWDVIEQEALTLANHIEDDEEKTISPRKSESIQQISFRSKLTVYNIGFYSGRLGYAFVSRFHAIIT